MIPKGGIHYDTIWYDRIRHGPTRSDEIGYDPVRYKTIPLSDITAHQPIPLSITMSYQYDTTRTKREAMRYRYRYLISMIPIFDIADIDTDA